MGASPTRRRSRTALHLQGEINSGRAAHLQHDILPLGGGEALRGHRYQIGSRRQFEELIDALVVAFDRSGKSRSAIVQRDGGAGDDRTLGSVIVPRRELVADCVKVMTARANRMKISTTKCRELKRMGNSPRPAWGVHFPFTFAQDLRTRPGDPCWAAIVLLRYRNVQAEFARMISINYLSRST